MVVDMGTRKARDRYRHNRLLGWMNGVVIPKKLKSISGKCEKANRFSATLNSMRETHVLKIFASQSPTTRPLAH